MIAYIGPPIRNEDAPLVVYRQWGGEVVAQRGVVIPTDGNLSQRIRNRIAQKPATSPTLAAELGAHVRTISALLEDMHKSKKVQRCQVKSKRRWAWLYGIKETNPPQSGP